jgi:hypothetical protein
MSPVDIVTVVGDMDLLFGRLRHFVGKKISIEVFKLQAVQTAHEFRTHSIQDWISETTGPEVGRF